MEKETQKQKIERLENNEKILKGEIETLYVHLNRAQDESDENFKASPYCKSLNEELSVLKSYKKMTEKTLEKNAIKINNLLMLLDEKDNIIQKLNNEKNISADDKKEKIHNERGAGRKPTFAKDVIAQIEKDRKSGMTIKKLSEKYSCSVGKIHKIISEK